jgi:hypothetical protein
MQQPTSPNPTPAPLARNEAGAPLRSSRPRTALRRRHVEAHAVAWLRSLRAGKRVGSTSAEADRARG